MKISLILVYVLQLFVISTNSATATTLTCSHPELCRLAKMILTKNQITGIKFKNVVNIVGDPHEYEPTAMEVKELINSEILITGPMELNPWVKNIFHQRSKLKDVKTIALRLDKNDFQLYQSKNSEALSHFWLYPKLYCLLRDRATLEFVKNGMIKKPIPDDTCTSSSEKIIRNLSETVQGITFPLILTHDALMPLFESLNSKNSSVIAIKGSGHHHEATPQSVKKLYDALRSPQVIWIEESAIQVPQNIINKKRKNDITIKIDTANSSEGDPFSVLTSLEKELRKYLR